MMKNHAKKRIVLEALLTGDSLGQAAEKAGVHRNTITTWVREPAFINELNSAEHEALETVSRALVSLAGKAIQTLEEVLQGGYPDATRVRAADIVLSRLLQVRELVDLENRVTELEKVVNQ